MSSFDPVICTSTVAAGAVVREIVYPFKAPSFMLSEDDTTVTPATTTFTGTDDDLWGTPMSVAVAIRLCSNAEYTSRPALSTSFPVEVRSN